MVENSKEDFKFRMINKISLAPMVRMVPNIFENYILTLEYSSFSSFDS